MKKIIVTVLFILCLIAQASSLLALDRGGERGKGMWNREGYHHRRTMPPLEARLNLTKEQQTRIRALRLDFLKNIKPLEDECFSKRGDLRLLLLQQPTLDKDKILAAHKEIRKIEDQIADRRIAFRVDVFNVLTPEQKEENSAFLKAHRFGHPGHHGRGQGMMGRGMAGPHDGCMCQLP